MAKVPEEFTNKGRLYLQAMNGGEAAGRPDASMAFFLGPGQVHLFEYAHSKGTGQPAQWTKNQVSAASFVKGNEMGGGTVSYMTRMGSDTLVLKAKGVIASVYLDKRASDLHNEPMDTYFYATEHMILDAATLNTKNISPFATHLGGGNSANVNGAPVTAGSGSGSSSGGSTPSSSGGSTPSSASTTTGTSQSTMYLIGGGALIALLFLFTQKK